MYHSFLMNLRQDWLGNVRGDLLAGLVVALALIPEAIAFSIIAGVDPKVGLYASFSIAVLTAITGGRPGMISAATAATAVLMISLVKDHENGLQLLFAATILAGILQIAMGLLKLGNAMRFVSRSVLTGFVNALAILIFLAQLPEILPASVPDFIGSFLKATHIDHKVDMLWLTWAMIAGGLAIIYVLPRITTLIPSPLLCIIVLTTLSLVFKWDVRSVSDLGKLPDGLPFFMLPQVPLTLETLMIILPYSLAIAVVGLLESLMTTSIVDELTDTKGNKNQECIGQGIANTTTGFIGGMAGCAMIGQSVINVKSGGRGRLSCFAAGILLLIFVVPLSKWVGLIPMPALVAIMIMVSIGTFSWSSIGNLFRHPRSSSIVMLTVVGSVIFTHNLAIGVLVGVLLSGIFFASKIAQIFHVSSQSTDSGKSRTYTVTGQLFFASVEDFNNSFDFKEALNKVTIDVSDAHIWDISSVQALDAVVLKFRREGANVQVIGLNKASKTIVDKLGEADKKNAMDRIAEH